MLHTLRECIEVPQTEAISALVSRGQRGADLPLLLMTIITTMAIIITPLMSAITEQWGLASCLYCFLPLHLFQILPLSAVVLRVDTGSGPNECGPLGSKSLRKSPALFGNGSKEGGVFRGLRKIHQSASDR